MHKMAMAAAVMATVIVQCMVTFVPFSAKAETAFDGVYDFTWTAAPGSYYSGSATRDAFLIITDGEISDADADKIYEPPANWPAGLTPTGSRGDGIYWYTFIGSVDSSGTANWRGGCMMASGNFDYTYIGTINADGTGSGTYSGNEHGTWSVQKSDSDTSIDRLELGPIPLPMIGLAGVGAIGAAVVIVTRRTRKSKRGFRPVQEKYPSQYHRPTPSEVRNTDDGRNPSYSTRNMDPMGGAGITYGPEPARIPRPPADWDGKGPPPPGVWYTKTRERPLQCPNHPGIYVQPIYDGGGDNQGAWYCPICRGYPWGKGR
jgi:hypothetical protein